MKYRKLRIAWSVAWGVVAVLLCALWCRSCYWSDHFYRVTRTQEWNLTSECGYTLSIVRFDIRSYKAGEWRHYQGPVDASIRRKTGVLFPAVGTWRGFHYEKFGTLHEVGVPYWGPFSLRFVFAVVPWIRHLNGRFSLFALLIATTVSSAALGVFIYFNRPSESPVVPAKTDIRPPTLWPYLKNEESSDSSGISPMESGPTRVDRPAEQSLFK